MKSDTGAAAPNPTPGERLHRAVCAIASQTGEPAEQIIDWLCDGGLAQMVLAAVAPKDATDTARLAWVANAWGGQRPDFAQHVLVRGGTGDLSDIRTFVDAAQPARTIVMQEVVDNSSGERVMRPMTDARHAAAAAPIDMILYCPKCGAQHVDKPEGQFIPGFTAAESVEWCKAHGLWENPPHKSHLCHGCKHVWRPADVPTNGVAAIKTVGKNDSPVSAPAAEAVAWRFKDLAGNTHYADHVSSLAQSEITPLFAAPPTELLREVMEALTLAKNDLVWYRHAMPEADNPVDDKVEEQIDAALAKLREQLGEQG